VLVEPMVQVLAVVPRLNDPSGVKVFASHLNESMVVSGDIRVFAVSKQHVDEEETETEKSER